MTQFTDRFKKFPIETFVNEEDKFLDEESREKRKVKLRLDTSAITSYYPEIGKDSDEQKTAVYLQGGTCYSILLPIIEFERQLNELESGHVSIEPRTRSNDSVHDTPS